MCLDDGMKGGRPYSLRSARSSSNSRCTCAAVDSLLCRGVHHAWSVACLTALCPVACVVYARQMRREIHTHKKNDGAGVRFRNTLWQRDRYLAVMSCTDYCAHVCEGPALADNRLSCEGGAFPVEQVSAAETCSHLAGQPVQLLAAYRQQVLRLLFQPLGQRTQPHRSRQTSAVASNSGTLRTEQTCFVVHHASRMYSCRHHRHLNAAAGNP